MSRFESQASISPPERTVAICRAATRFALLQAWAAIPEFPLPNGRRADLLCLLPDGSFAVVEVKSGLRDFLADAKWPEYREFCDRLYFAVDTEFPAEVLPEDAGLLVAAEGEAAQLRPPPEHRLAPARRRALLHRFAMLAARRLSGLADPSLAASIGAALRCE
ncbi:MmcB family DNA repair protein [Siccirubricoccus sp. KC 17139]|uniref:MmcB family DNA repair protein n=1 Tax=Siccirubricoccus soli TaxID=2899147 RepID=A0ABT1CZ43_9PROT|nr:MmcB family DNA repair protein [Siccirubricoccus soli]MCO6414677.1 MmcB family DNA repair protein [Siccirubricoccus soli]MCP2680807.1 MmcB family DNA repair protein [Siccirubricoccus soli]